MAIGSVKIISISKKDFYIKMGTKIEQTAVLIEPILRNICAEIKYISATLWPTFFLFIDTYIWNLHLKTKTLSTDMGLYDPRLKV